MIGKTIAGFQILEEIGRGSTATVYKAHQVSLDRTVAVRILSPALALGLEEITHFQQDAQAAARLKYNAIVQVYEASEAEGVFFIATELVKGYNLAAWIKRDGRIAEANVLIIAESVAHALNYAWQSAHLVHRNLKPENVLVDEDGTIKVADLGVTPYPHNPAPGKPQFAGGVSARYASPEQVTGQHSLDCRTDIYSLGVLLHHLVSGQEPFPGLTADAIVQRYKQAQFEDPRAAAPGTSAPFTLFLRKLLARERHDRYRDWDEVIADMALVKARKKPAHPLPLSARSALRHQAPSKATAAASGTAAAKPARRTPGVKPVLRKAAATPDDEGEAAPESAPAPVAAGPQPSAKPLVIAIVIGAIVAIIIIIVALARNKDDDPRDRKGRKASSGSVRDFGSGF